MADFKLLYATGAMRLNQETNKVEWPRALRYTIRNGVVYDVEELLADVACPEELREALEGIWADP